MAGRPDDGIGKISNGGAEGADVDAAATSEAAVDRQGLGGEHAHDVGVDLFAALLVEALVASEGDDVGKERASVDAAAVVADYDRGMVGLARDGAARAKEVGGEGLLTTWSEAALRSDASGS